jgi:transposase
MGKRLGAHLSEEDRQALEQVVKKSSDWRARACAKTVLLLGQSLLCREVAQVQDLNIGTVGQTWRRWREEGMAALSDKPRCGAPRKLDEEDAQRLARWAREQPLSAPELLQRHTDARGKPVHVGTFVRYLKEGGLVCKRTRHSLKRKEVTPPLSALARRSQR